MVYIKNKIQCCFNGDIGKLSAPEIVNPNAKRRNTKIDKLQTEAEEISNQKYFSNSKITKINTNTSVQSPPLPTSYIASSKQKNSKDNNQNINNSRYNTKSNTNLNTNINTNTNTIKTNKFNTILTSNRISDKSNNKQINPFMISGSFDIGGAKEGNNKSISDIKNYDNSKININESKSLNSSSVHINTDYYPKLYLEIISSKVYPKGLILKINTAGLEDSRRKKKDGITYFGFIDENENDNIEMAQQNNYIDYIMEPKDKDYDEKYIGRHFKIEYNSNTNKYYLQDLGKGFGTFIKVVNELKLEDNYLVNLGESFLVVNYKYNYDQEHSIDLILNVISGNEKQMNYSFNSKKVNEITLGRDIDCDITVEDLRLSRIHCKFMFIKGDWYIKDGNGVNKSTNGIWVYVRESTEIKNKMVFKSNHNLFECTYRMKEGESDEILEKHLNNEDNAY